jgi:hypothetical protein
MPAVDADMKLDLTGDERRALLTGLPLDFLQLLERFIEERLQLADQALIAHAPEQALVSLDVTSEHGGFVESDFFHVPRNTCPLERANHQPAIKRALVRCDR